MKQKFFSQLAAMVLVVLSLIFLLMSLIKLISASESVMVYIFVMIIALILLFFAMQLFLVTRRIHPAIKKHFVFSLNISDIKQKADNGEPFDLPLGKEMVKIQVVHDPIYEEGAEIIEVLEDGESRRQTMQEQITYSGWVVEGKEETDVRLTITDNFLLGYVMRNNEWWFVEPLKTVLPDAEDNDYLFYKTKDLKFKLNLEDDVVPRMVEQFDPDSLPDGSGYLPPPPPPPPPNTKWARALALFWWQMKNSIKPPHGWAVNGINIKLGFCIMSTVSIKRTSKFGLHRKYGS